MMPTAARLPSASGMMTPSHLRPNGPTGQVRGACETNDVSEGDAIKAVQNPATVESLVRDLRSLGLRAGMTVMVHSSLSQIGYVSGGAHAVVEALLEAVGITGTIVMPTHSTDLSDPSTWSNPPVPSAWWDKLRKHMPAYDERLTPTRRMGAITPTTPRSISPSTAPLRPARPKGSTRRRSSFTANGNGRRTETSSVMTATSNGSEMSSGEPASNAPAKLAPRSPRSCPHAPSLTSQPNGWPRTGPGPLRQRRRAG